jgi:DNA-binding MarR family transcriptional regulator
MSPLSRDKPSALGASAPGASATTTDGRDGSADDTAAVGLRLLRLSSRIYRLQTETLEGLSAPLSLSQFRILDRVDQGVTTLGRLAELARRRPSTTSKSADSLVRQGLLTRTEAAEDRRNMVLCLTPEGEALLAEARAAMMQLASWLASASGLASTALGTFVDGLYEETERATSSGDLPASYAAEP